MIKLTKKELKTPDQIWQTSRSLLSWLTDQFTVVMILCAVLFFGIVGGVYFYHIRDKKEGTAQFHYSLARGSFEKWKLAVESKKLDEQSKADLELKKELEILSKDFSSSLANRLANEIRAQLATKSKNWAEAISQYQAFEKALPGSDKELALLPLANTFEQSGDFSNALKTYEDILIRKNSVYVPLALLGKGRSLRELKKIDEAKQTYETFLSQHPTSPEVAEVRGILAMLQDDLKK